MGKGKGEGEGEKERGDSESATERRAMLLERDGERRRQTTNWNGIGEEEAGMKGLDAKMSGRGWGRQLLR
ncbi:hypothetical protein ACLOJK_028311, partial [Asimina triloba]